MSLHAITNPDKIIYPKHAITKLQVANYYQSVNSYMLPLIHDRPLTLQRFPHGIGSSISFFQKNVPDYFPASIERLNIPNKSKDGSTLYPVCNNLTALWDLINEYCFVIHAWLATKAALDKPDRLIIDLDPSGEDFNFETVKVVAKDLKVVFEKLHLSSFVMTTGSRGLHVVVPLDATTSFDEVRSFAHTLVDWFNTQHPTTTTTNIHIKERKNLIFLDVARNAYGQTGIAPYSVRAHEDAPIATPLHWDELDDIKLTSRTYTLSNIEKRLVTVNNPWTTINHHKGSIKHASQKLNALMNRL